MKGESLYSLFSAHGLSSGALMELVSADKAIERRLARLQPGDTITVHRDAQGILQRLHIASRRMNSTLITREESEFAIHDRVDVSGAAEGAASTPALPAGGAAAASVATASTTPAPPVESEPVMPLLEQTFVLEKGQSLYQLFQAEKLSRIDLIAMTKADAAMRKRLDRVQPGQVLHVGHRGGDIETLRLAARRGKQDYLITRSEAGYTGRVAPSLVASKPVTAEESESASSAGQDEAADPIMQAAASYREKAEEQQEKGPGEIGLPVLPAAVVEHELAVQPGESLFLIFKRLGVPPADLARVMNDDDAKSLRTLRPGQVLSVRLLADNRLLSLSSDIDDTRNITVLRQPDDSMRVELKHTPLERRMATATGVIEDSLFLSGQRAGLSDRVIMQLVGVFGWDVDFALDVRAGDRFTVVYEELYKDGEKVRDGNILAGEFINAGRQLRGLRFTDAAGNTSYYTPEGLSMRKAFLRTPVAFSRISSRFSLARRHPVLNKIRAHRGVDYAAPTGTPIKAAGNGRVTFSGWRRGYGRTVQLQHGGKYATLYAHMSRIHPRAKSGRRVSQGDVIGYIGSTGLATGPHLHYEFRVNGVHKDPLRVKLPKALPIEKQHRADFEAAAGPLIAQLDLLAKTRLAATE